MKVCVFGASGYVGESVYKLLKNVSDVDVVGTYLEDSLDIPDDFKKLDVNEPESFSNFYKKEKPDVVVWSVMSGLGEYKLTDEGLIHLITHLTPDTKLIYISSDLVFAEGKGPYNEEDPLSKIPDDHFLSKYVNAKVKAERLIDNELSNYVILRAGPVYGKNQVGQLDEYTDKLLSHLRTGRTISFRDDLIRTFVHVTDLANVVKEMVKNDITGTYHVGKSAGKSYYEFMKSTAVQQGFETSPIKKEQVEEEADHELPKDTSLDTGKITEIMRINF